MKALNHLITRLHNLAIKRLEAPRQVYEQRVFNNMDKLLEVVRKGDVILVEGRSEISRFIKLFTNSSWSHSALYIGDELLKKDHRTKEKYQMKFGANAGHLLIEAEVGKGVTVVPLRKYKDYNIRICRQRISGYLFRHDRKIFSKRELSNRTGASNIAAGKTGIG